MKFNNTEGMLIVILCVTSIIDTLINVLEYLK
jgi:hypothetical protein